MRAIAVLDVYNAGMQCQSSSMTYGVLPVSFVVTVVKEQQQANGSLIQFGAGSTPHQQPQQHDRSSVADQQQPQQQQQQQAIALAPPVDALLALTESARFSRDNAAAAWRDGATLPALLQLLRPPKQSSGDGGSSSLQSWLHAQHLPRLLQAAAALLGYFEGQMQAPALQVRLEA
jgi:hypothetical protein